MANAAKDADSDFNYETGRFNCAKSNFTCFVNPFKRKVEIGFTVDFTNLDSFYIPFSRKDVSENYKRLAREHYVNVHEPISKIEVLKIGGHKLLTYFIDYYNAMQLQLVQELEKMAERHTSNLNRQILTCIGFNKSEVAILKLGGLVGMFCDKSLYDPSKDRSGDRQALEEEIQKVTDEEAYIHALKKNALRPITDSINREVDSIIVEKVFSTEYILWLEEKIYEVWLGAVSKN